MKTRAAVLWAPGEPWSVEEIELDEPAAGEVLVELTASGLCHSDEHFRDGTSVIGYPFIGGHEGSGIVRRIGPGVTELEPGIMSSSASSLRVGGAVRVPGECRACATWVRTSE